MKIVQICPRFLPYYGGIVTHVNELSKNLVKLGANVCVYTTDPNGLLPKEDLKNGVKILRFRSYSINDFYFLAPRLYMELRKMKDVDVVHVHNYQDYCVLAATLAKRKFKRPLVFTPHYHPSGGNELRTIVKKFYDYMLAKYFFKESDKIIAVSKYEKKILQEKFNISCQKIVYIPNGVTALKNSACKSLSYIEGNLKDRTRTILYVGRLEKYKGVHFLIRAFSKVASTVKDCKLLVVGEGSYKSALISLSNRLKIRNKVFFLNHVNELELTRLYLSSDIFIMLSQYEAFCIALAEAMGYGLPVIATKVGGITELVGNDRGFLIEYPPDIDALAKIIIRLLKSPKLSQETGYKAKNYILSNFSWESIAKKHLDIYQQLIN